VTVTPSPGATGGPCPTTLEIQGDEAGVDLDKGWTGRTHDLEGPFFDRLTLGISSCEGTNSPACGDCDLTGPLANSGASNRRCRHDTSIVCTTTTDCSGNPCDFYLAPNYPTLPGGIALCEVLRLPNPVVGVTSPDTGDIDISIDVFVDIRFGETADKPCATCVGDPTPNDGVRGGTCNGGNRPGLTCDQHAFSTIFNDPLSYDCPTGFSFLSHTFKLPLSTDGGSATLTAANPNCRETSFTGLECFCDVCSNSSATCMSDADCPGGTCGNALQAPTRPNGCTNGVCSPNTPPDDDSIDEGVCAGGPNEGFCAIERYRPCIANVECTTPGDSCVAVARECYTDNGVVGAVVEVGGMTEPPVSGVAGVELGGLFCVPPNGNSAISAGGGYPGLGRITVPATAIFD
jgi:hypothetical protein